MTFRLSIVLCLCVPMDTYQVLGLVYATVDGLLVLLDALVVCECPVVNTTVRTMAIATNPNKVLPITVNRRLCLLELPVMVVSYVSTFIVFNMSTLISFTCSHAE